MSMQQLGSPRLSGSDADAISLELRRFEEARRTMAASNDDADALARIAQDQIARDIEDIERATAVLQRAEPALESWSDVPARMRSKPQPLWLLIGVLWLSTALVTAGAVVAIASFAG
jgi:hypothetical protein